jgi:hypothetical protein
MKMTDGTASAGSEDAVAAALQALGGGANPDATQLMELIAPDADPRTRLMLQLIASQGEGDDDKDEDLWMERRTDRTDRALRRAREAIERLRKQNRLLREEAAALADIRDALAQALGACPVCFGMQQDCVDCDGTGVGDFDQDLYETLVQPYIRNDARNVRSTERPLLTPE